MGRWLTEDERAAREAMLEDARERWVGTALDYGEFSREVFDVEWDEVRDRLILCARTEDEDGYVPEVASNWERESL